MTQQHTTQLLKPKQNDILLLLYSYRFLNRTQIQLFLKHKHFNRIIIWLNELTTKKYIRRYYDPAKVTQAAIYSLGDEGRKYLLKTQDEATYIEPHLLDRVWTEPRLSLQFRNHCLLVADIALSLYSLVAQTHGVLQYETKTDLFGREDLLLPLPDVLFSITEQNGDVRQYLVDIFDELPPRMILRKRIRQHVEYFDSEVWQDTNEAPFPAVIFVCPDERSKKYLYKQIQKTLIESPELVFYLTTKDLIKQRGMRAEALQEVTCEE